MAIAGGPGRGGKGKCLIRPVHGPHRPATLS